MATKLYNVIQWVKDNGKAHSVNRMRLKVLASTVKEGISLDKITPNTDCSDACLDAVRKAAATVVGKPCPV